MRGRYRVRGGALGRRRDKGEAGTVGVGVRERTVGIGREEGIGRTGCVQLRQY